MQAVPLQTMLCPHEILVADQASLGVALQMMLYPHEVLVADQASLGVAQPTEQAAYATRNAAAVAAAAAASARGKVAA